MYISYEIYPPKTTTSALRLGYELQQLARHKPDFISVTCGAGGSSNNDNTELCNYIRNGLDTACIAHLTCIGMQRQEIEQRLKSYQSMGLNSVLVLRGDNPDDVPITGALSHASDLVQLVRNHVPGMDMYVAGYPEGHIQNPSFEDDFCWQTRKAEHAKGIISQLFFDNACFLDYAQRTREAGFNGDILAGIFPITNAKQIDKISQLCKVTIPPAVLRALHRYRNNPQALQAFGVDYASEQIIRLVEAGHNHFHMYCMNQSKHIEQIRNNLQIESRVERQI